MMEKKFYNDNFERLLRNKLDEFKMLPSKRIWHSIYNDLHPGKKWPSITIGLFLFTILGLIGYLNTANNSYKHSSSEESIKITAFLSNSDKQGLPSTSQYSAFNNDAVSLPIQKHDSKLTTKDHIKNNGSSDGFLITQTPIKVNNANNVLFEKPNFIEKVNTISANSTSIRNDAKINVRSLVNIPKNQGINATNIEQKGTEISDKDKAWVNYVLKHVFKKKIWQGKISYQVYVTPNLNFRKLSAKNRNDENTVSNILHSLNQQPALGMEIGGGITYTVNKNLRLKTGLQFDYTNYAITALEMNHPAITTLLMTDAASDYSYLEAKATSLSNTFSSKSTKYHNETYQLSIPLGVEYKLAGKGKIQWYASANIQPTYSFTGNAYLISSDAKNYVRDKSLINKWSINTGLETFLSYKTKNDIRLQFGPQYRYQLTSTYKNYGISENLYHLGIKFGISKNL